VLSIAADGPLGQFQLLAASAPVIGLTRQAAELEQPEARLQLGGG